ncbi:MAG: antiporter, partial [Cyanobacteria bacterium NC_groundwater_1444_Ag_S-0.65um_54_12]|nr:antiporter [Cyanobacteria bacterium NC_groundwater_1444_Ag_S-0.65um_54_12]
MSQIESLSDDRDSVNTKQARIDRWDPEDPSFWSTAGKSHATRNLLISIPCLLCAFAIWIFWSIITVQMKNLGFPFSNAQLFTLSAIAGLAGATLRIPNAFMIGIAGGRIIIAVSTILLIIPALGVGIALQHKTTPYEVFLLLAALSGIGGGNFSSSMSNITMFFPKHSQGIALGLNAGLGNLGVSITQILLPALMTFPLFGLLSGSGMPLTDVAGAKAGTLVWIQNAGMVWVPVLLVLGLVAWWGMDSLPAIKIGSPLLALIKVTALGLVGFAGTVL